MSAIRPGIVRAPSLWLPGQAPLGSSAEFDRTHPQSRGMLAWWTSAFGDFATEITGQRAKLTLAGTGTPTNGVSRLGPTKTLGGTNWWTGSDVGFPNGDNPRTLSIWASTASAATAPLLWYYGTASGSQSLFFYLASGTFLDLSTNSLNYTAAGSTSFIDGKLRHYIMSYSGGGGSGVKVLVDGLDLTSYGGSYVGASGAISTITGGSGLFIGAYITGSDQWTGAIDNFKIWNRALSTQEMLAEYYEPFGQVRPVAGRRRTFAVGGGNTVFFTGRGLSIATGRTVSAQSTAIVGRTSPLAPGRALASPTAPLAARTQADAAGRASPTPSAPLTAHTEATAPGKAALGLAAPVAARTEGAPSGRATTSLAAPLASKTQAGARGQAAAGGVSQLSGSARTQGASAGRATGSAATSLSGRTAGAASGKAAAAPSAPLSGKTQAGSRASATAGGVSQLSALARTAGLAAGRAAPSLGATVAGRARGNGAAKGSPSPSAAVSAKTQGGARGQGFAGGVSLLFGSASTTGAAAGRAALSSGIVLAGKSSAKSRGTAGLGATSPLSAAGATRGRAAGRAAIAVSAAISASTISRGAMRSGLAAGTALVAVTRSRAFGHAINGDQNPLFFDIGRVATIPADARLAILPVDIRAVTISGST